MTEQEIAEELLRITERLKMDDARRAQPAGQAAALPETPQAGPDLDEYAYIGRPTPPVTEAEQRQVPPQSRAAQLVAMAKDYEPTVGAYVRGDQPSTVASTGGPSPVFRPRGAWRQAVAESGLNEALPYYLGPHLGGALDKVGRAAGLVTPGAGTMHDTQQAGEEIERGNYGRAAAAVGLGTAGGMLDLLPGSGIARGIMRGITGGTRILNEALPAAGAAAIPMAGRAKAAMDLAEGYQDTVGKHVRGEPHNQGPPLVPAMTGSPEINSQIPVTMGGKEPKDWSPGDWGTYGRAHDEPRLGPPSDEAFAKSLVTYKDNTGRPFTVPGGLEDPKKPFTYYDILHMKAQGIDPNNLAPDLHRRLHNRTVQTMQPGPTDDPFLTNYNAAVMGMLSPNNPLLPNELAMQRTMAKSPADIEWMAGQTPWDPGTAGIGKDVRGPASRGIAKELGLQAEERGGLGATGSVDYTRVSDFAKMYGEKPEFFKFDPATQPGETAGEKWSNYVAKVSSQVPGLQMKTGSFGAVWQDPSGAAISAIDRHMATKFHDDLFTNPKERAAFEKDAVKTYNVGRPRGDRAANFEEMLDSKGGRGVYIEKVMGHLNAHSQPKFRLASGEINPRIPEHLQQADWVREPSNVVVPSAPYARALDANQALALQNEQGLFANQWMEWDKIRQRYEPHEIKHPALQKLPRMTLEQMRDVNTAHKELGYATAPAKVRATMNPSSLGYFSLAPFALLGLPKEPPDDQK